VHVFLKWCRISCWSYWMIPFWNTIFLFFVYISVRHVNEMMPYLLLKLLIESVNFSSKILILDYSCLQLHKTLSIITFLIFDLCLQLRTPLPWSILFFYFRFFFTVPCTFIAIDNIHFLFCLELRPPLPRLIKLIFMTFTSIDEAVSIDEVVEVRVVRQSISYWWCCMRF
jgi:hypothetical protein